MLGATLVDRGQFESAATSCRRALTLDPDYAEAHGNLGVALHGMGQFEKAVASCRRALAIDPDFVQAHGAMGASLQSLGRFEDAVASYRRAVELNADFAPTHCNLGAGLIDLKQFEEAAASCRRALAIDPAYIEAHCNLGIALQGLGQFDAAVESCRRALAINPDYAEAHNSLATALQALGHLDEALVSYQRALVLRPQYAEAHNNMGNVLRDLRQMTEAVTSYRHALAINPHFAEAHNNLGVALQVLEQLDESAACFRRALAIKPRYAEAYSNLGSTLQDLGLLDEAVACCRQALAINPGLAGAHNNLGNALRDQRQFDAAIESYRKALAINPDFAEAHYNLGIALRDCEQFDDAVASLRRALEINPDFGEAHSSLGSIYGSMGKMSEARASYAKAQALGFESAWVLDALMLPPIMGTKAEMLESRAAFERNLEQLMRKAVPQRNPFRNVALTNFYLAYHALNDRDLQIEVAKYYEQACPSLLYTAPHCLRPKVRAGQKIRVGFFSKYLYEHSVSLCYSEIVESLSSNDQFDVTLISDRPADEKTYSKFAGRRVQVPHNIDRARELIAAQELDILVYLDIGMEPLSYFLAFARLARVQCVLSGHPVTTGITNVDYFLSNDPMEPPGAEAHYSEKLGKLPKPLFYLARPAIPARLKTRTELGLPEGQHLYMCPMRLQKMHPDFDEAITRILQIDDTGVVVLFEDVELKFGKKLLLQRFEKTVPADVRERVVFLPWLKNQTDFMSAIAAADVILDPFHFGIGSTAMTTIAIGTPMVTKAGEFMRGRVGMWLCELMELPECITHDTEAYAQKAVQLAGNPALRESVVAKMRKNSHRLYENLQPVDDFANFLRSVAGESTNQAAHHVTPHSSLSRAQH
ncbi:MAG: tetratricopeptide repeat protein [Betaproteobacteria bacterium]